MTEETVEQLSMLDQDTWSGKTSPEHSAPTKEKTSESYSKKQRKSLTKMPLFLDLRRASGQRQDASWQMGGALLGEYSMHSFGESPKEDVESHLSQILEDNPHQKYCLSDRACLGILNRANRRGKVLPNVLEEALIQTILRGTDGGEPAVAYSIENHPQDSRVDIDESGKVQTLTGRMGTGGGNVPMVVVSLDRSSYNQGKKDVSVAYAVDCRNASVNTDTNVTLQAKESGGTSYNLNNVVITTCPRYIVRRLTPMECERLQGYPDGWTDIGEYTNSNGKKCKASDASRYKALGNSIALPSWKWVLKRICGCYERDATMASLFDGLGGFPYLWQQINGKGSCLWASEIEEFPIAVTKERIG